MENSALIIEWYKSQSSMSTSEATEVYAERNTVDNFDVVGSAVSIDRNTLEGHYSIHLGIVARWRMTIAEKNVLIIRCVEKGTNWSILSAQDANTRYDTIGIEFRRAELAKIYVRVHRANILSPTLSNDDKYLVCLRYTLTQHWLYFYIRGEILAEGYTQTHN